MSFTSSVMERNKDHMSGNPRRKLFEEIYTRSVLYSLHTLNLQRNPACLLQPSNSSECFVEQLSEHLELICSPDSSRDIVEKSNFVD